MRSPALPLIVLLGLAALTGCADGLAKPPSGESTARAKAADASSGAKDAGAKTRLAQDPRTKPSGTEAPRTIPAGAERGPAWAGATKGAPAPTGPRETAVLAGGCFWGMQEILRGVPGVIATDVGYAGGTSPSPTYRQVSTGKTGHAESVRVIFDPARLSYAELLESWFFRMHDPTTLDRQGNDVGSQYRSAIFPSTPEQTKTALEVIARVQRSGRWKQPVVTRVERATGFTPAEDLHQDYLQKNPGGYTCHYLRD